MRIVQKGTHQTELKYKREGGEFAAYDFVVQVRTLIVSLSVFLIITLNPIPNHNPVLTPVLALTLARCRWLQCRWPKVTLSSLYIPNTTERPGLTWLWTMAQAHLCRW